MAYTVADLQSSVQDDLHDPSFNATRILRYLNNAQNHIFNTHMFKFCERAVVGSLTIGADNYAQQSDHQTTIGGSLSDGTNVVLQLDGSTYMPHRQFFDLFPAPTMSNGRPSRWTEFGNQLYFDRPVEAAYTLRQRYFRMPAQLTAAGDVPTVPESFRELLEQYVMCRAEKYRGNHDFAATYKQEFEDGLESMVLRFSEATQVGPTTIASARMHVGEQ